MKFSFAAAIFIFLNIGLAQEIPTSDPIVRPRNAEESSSFMGDPDQLDPLPVNRENLKEDEEPVLDDIRQVLNAPAVKKKPKKIGSSTQSQEKASVTDKASVTLPTNTSAKPATPVKKKGARKIKKQSPLQSSPEAELTSDDPD